jgi:hypothetical protein
LILISKEDCSSVLKIKSFESNKIKSTLLRIHKSDHEKIEFALILSVIPLFAIRYFISILIKATKWSIKQIKE